MAAIDRIKLYILAPALLILAFGCRTNEPQPVPALLPPTGVADDTAVVTRRDVESSIYLHARLKPEETEMKFGNTYLAVKQLAVMLGQKVTKGDVLIRLDTEFIQKDIDELTEQLDKVLRQYEYNAADRQTEIGVAQIELNSLYANEADQDSIQLQRLNLQRLNLLDSQAQEAEELDIARRREDIDRLVKLRDEAELVSDTDGTVVSITILPGEYVKPFQVGAVIADESSIYAEYTGKVSTSDFTNIQAITAHIGDAWYEMAYEPMPIDRLITYIFSGTTPPSKFVFKDQGAQRTVKPGETAELHCVRKISENTLAIPVNTLYSDGAGSRYVYVQTRDSAGNKVRTLTPVKTGLANESVTEITEGLNEGDVVYVKP